jgi:hypothetical protein
LNIMFQFLIFISSCRATLVSLIWMVIGCWFLPAATVSDACIDVLVYILPDTRLSHYLSRKRGQLALMLACFATLVAGCQLLSPIHTGVCSCQIVDHTQRCAAHGFASASIAELVVTAFRAASLATQCCLHIFGRHPYICVGCAIVVVFSS